MKKSQKWYDAMRARRGTPTNQWTKNPEHKITEATREKMRKSATGRKHTEETKNKQSAAMKKFLRDNPIRVPYLLNHYSKGPSYPERYFTKIFAKYDSVIPQFRFHTYSLDFAIPSKQIDIEIDGSQHYLDEKIVQHDIRRDAFMKESGWNVIRIRWAEYKKLDKDSRKDYITNLINSLGLKH